MKIGVGLDIYLSSQSTVSLRVPLERTNEIFSIIWTSGGAVPNRKGDLNLNMKLDYGAIGFPTIHSEHKAKMSSTFDVSHYHTIKTSVPRLGFLQGGAKFFQDEGQINSALAVSGRATGKVQLFRSVKMVNVNDYFLSPERDSMTIGYEREDVQEIKTKSEYEINILGQKKFIKLPDIMVTEQSELEDIHYSAPIEKISDNY